MKNISLVAVFVLFSCCLYGQSKFKEAYIITHEGDTISGFAEYSFGSSNNEYCLFKRSSQDPAVRILPDSIKGYGFPSDKVMISIQPEEGDPILFYEQLVVGSINLYKYDQSFFAQKGIDKVYELKNEKREVTANGVKSIMYTREYAGMLNFLMADCESIKPTLQSLSYSEKALIKAVNQYNLCVSNETMELKREMPHTIIDLGIAGGYLNAHYSINDGPAIFSYIDEFDNDGTYIMGIDLSILNPRLHDRIGIHTGLLYTSTSYETTFMTGLRNNTITIDLSEIKIPVGLKYILTKNNLTTYLSAGMANSLYLKSEFLL